MRLRGRLNPPPGGSVPLSHYSGPAVTIGDGLFAQLPLDALDSGPALLDIAAPAAPTFAASGVYLVTGLALATAPLTANGLAQFTVQIGSTGLGSSLVTEWAVFAMSVASVNEAAAGDALALPVTNFDGAAARDFFIADLAVAKLS